MKKVVVGSKNPVKIQSVMNGFEKMFPHEVFEVEGVSADSEVSDQPMTNDETYQGALNRAKNSHSSIAKTDFQVGIEGGLQRVGDDLEVFARIVILGSDGEKLGRARTSSFFLPAIVSKLIDEGKELGEADDIVFGQINSKQNSGAVGILTGDCIDRTSYYTDAVILALIPFKNTNLY